jgi:hypothetical protein
LPYLIAIDGECGGAAGGVRAQAGFCENVTWVALKCVEVERESCAPETSNANPMQTVEPSLALAQIDELTQLQLSVAQRADELMRLDRERRAERDYWREAEAEVLEARLGERRVE